MFRGRYKKRKTKKNGKTIKRTKRDIKRKGIRNQKEEEIKMVKRKERKKNMKKKEETMVIA